jgi:hypothetical protein
VKSGAVHAILDGTRNGASPGSCTAHGEADFALVPGQSSGEDYVQGVRRGVFTPAPFQSMDGNLTANTSWDRDQFSHLTSGFSFTPAS